VLGHERQVAIGRGRTGLALAEDGAGEHPAHVRVDDRMTVPVRERGDGARRVGPDSGKREQVIHVLGDLVAVPLGDRDRARVQRRPRPEGPPVQSPVLRQYISDLRQYVESNGAVFRDDTGDPDYPLAWYTDGDHTAFRYRQRYTELFAQKLAFLFQ